VKNETKAERKSDRELVVTRMVDAPARLVWRAWTEVELFRRWWVPKSFPITLLACTWEARVGGKYELVFQAGDQQMKFFGTFLEVVPTTRMVWTNEEGGDGGAVSTLTLEEQDGKTRVVVHDLYPSKAALDEAIASGSTSGMPEQLAQLEIFVTTEL
jgi:uncharacterized protein YndB with AHSA1/START domain